MGQATMFLHPHPNVRGQLSEHPEQVRGAVDDFLPLFAVARGPARTMTKDVEIAGVTLRTGDRLLLSRPAAHHDLEQFPDPYTFDLDRGSSRHLAMNVGTHFCLGLDLSKAISEQAIQTFLEKIPSFTST